MKKILFEVVKRLFKGCLKVKESFFCNVVEKRFANIEKTFQYTLPER